MTDQWQELKETITEMRDNDGTGTQQEVCKFLVNYMGILEKQMQESSEDVVSRQVVIDIVDSYSESQSNVEDVTQDIISDIVVLPSVNLQEPKTGEWNTFELFQSGIKETWYECPKCKWSNALLIPRNYCPNCGAKMIEPRESEG